MSLLKALQRLLMLVAACGFAAGCGSTAPSSAPDGSAARDTTSPSDQTTADSGEAMVVGTLSPISGNVTVTLLGPPEAVASEFELASGSTVTTDEGGFATLDASGTAVRFGTATEARVLADGSSMTIELSRGSLWWTQSPDAVTEVHVQLAGVVASSVGARALAGCDANGCFVGAVDGRVHLGGDAASSVELAALQFASVSAAAIATPTPFPPSALRAIDFAATNVRLDRQFGLRPTPADTEPVAAATTAQLDGNYSIVYRTVESDSEDVSPGDEVVRAASVHTNCVQLVCTVVLSTELKDPDGSIIVLDSPLTYDGASYLGALSSVSPCTDYKTNAVADPGIAYTASIVLVTNGAVHVDGTPTVSEFEITVDETNVVTDEGRAIDCRINLRADPFSVHTVVVGVGTHS